MARNLIVMAAQRLSDRPVSWYACDARCGVDISSLPAGRVLPALPGSLRKRPAVILSEAKHLRYLFENKQIQIVRFSQDDSPAFSAAC